MKKIALLILLAMILTACTPTNPGEFLDFTEPEPATYIRLLPIVSEYFYYRKQAVLSGNLDSFYQHFPSLAHNADLEKGINCEGHLVESYKALQPLDGNIHPEYYEKFKVLDSQTSDQILVHGLELYLWQDTDGTLKDSGGEFKLILVLHKIDDTWEITQTDEVTLAEWHDFVP